ncbi:MAG TPA: (2Fe-2S)-binding protein [Xanthobacteraceae bacterium]|nr:(2Fe-2S)-binding protein [Xanthobacteraceae bacterium]
MIVCSCNVISDHQVRSVAAERTVRATSEVYRCLGCSAECGRCARTIRRIMDEALVRATPPTAASLCICASAERAAPNPPAHAAGGPQRQERERLNGSSVVIVP